MNEEGLKSKLRKLPNRSDHNCFGCSSTNTMGLGLEFFTDEKTVFTFVKVPLHMCGWEKMVHGGIISTILDEIMSWTAIHQLKTFILTKSMTVDFLKPVFTDEELRAEGNVVEQTGPREAIVEGRLYTSEGKLSAKSRGVFALVMPDFLKKIGVFKDEDVEAVERLLKS